MTVHDLTPGLADVVGDGIENRLREVHTSIPARVVSFNQDRNTVDAEPLVRNAIQLEDGSIEEETDVPTIYAVPVAWPRGGGFSITWPIASGDVVLLVFSERSLARWKVHGRQDKADRFDWHNMDGAIAIPGGYPFTDATDQVGSALIVSGPSIKLGSKDATHPYVFGDDLKTALSTFGDALGNAVGQITAAPSASLVTSVAVTAISQATTTLNTSVQNALSQKIKGE